MSVEMKSNLKLAVKDTSVVVGAQSNDHSAHLATVTSKRFFTDADTFTRV
jgi:hypothetical protein